ncbi:lipase family protein [Gordonia sp. DT30]|uniref:lipase family protein n=1 Tax=unclassified Gordonia (in: high G+C Gram-positive bacteria) TaxID=2657482 RepID=UPI003CEA2865
MTAVAALAGAGGARGAPVVVPTVLAATPVTDPVVALPQAVSTTLIRYSSTSVRGQPTQMTGTLLLPRSAPPPGGWPLAVWNHMTVGAADVCAPSSARAGDPELAHMTSGNRIVGRLLDAGIAVVRPDFEGIGAPGPHPYLIGRSLARSTIDAALAVRHTDSRIGRDVVLAGHSEGAVAALFAAASPAVEWGGLRLRAVAAVTPPTHMGDIVSGVGQLPFGGAPTADLVGLAALLIHGAAAADPGFAGLVERGGLSPAARRLLPHLESRCYTGLSASDSFGGMAPTQLLGPRGVSARAQLAAIVDRNDVAHLRFPAGLPIRVDAGAYDAVAPLPVVAELVGKYRRAGTPVDFAVHPAGHTPVPTDPRTATAIAEWLTARLEPR